jgi:hypothetical protein
MSATGGGDLAGLFKMLSWLQTGFHVAIAIAFVIFCFVRARQVGVGGAWLLATMGLLDVVGLVIYRLAWTAVTSSHASMGTMDATFNALGAMGILFDLISIGLVAAAFFLLRKPPVPAYGGGPGVSWYS